VEEAAFASTEDGRLAAKIAVEVVSAIMEEIRPCVKFVVVMEYVITGKKGDIVLSAAEVQYAIMENTSLTVLNANGSRVE
jgi:hypothetical protein